MGIKNRLVKKNSRKDIIKISSNSMTYPKVSIIILNWNNYEDTKECLLSLDKITYPNYEVIVVDNGSVDGSTPKIQKEFPRHKYIYNKENLGFTEGNNIGMEYAMKKGTDFVLVLNNDITVENGFLESLVDIALKNPDAGIVGPAVYFYHEPEKLSPTGGKINYWRINNKVYDLARPMEMDWIFGCCLLIKREVIETIGYFYVPFFLSYEDTDYCVRAKKTGFKIVCEPRSKIWHKIGTTIKKNPVYFYYYFYRNKLLFIKRNAPFYIKFLFYFYFSLYLIFRIIEKLVKKDTLIAFAMKDALFDFWSGNFGKKRKFIKKT